MSASCMVGQKSLATLLWYHLIQIKHSLDGIIFFHSFFSLPPTLFWPHSNLHSFAPLPVAMLSSTHFWPHPIYVRGFSPWSPHAGRRGHIVHFFLAAVILRIRIRGREQVKITCRRRSVTVLMEGSPRRRRLPLAGIMAWWMALLYSALCWLSLPLSLSSIQWTVQTALTCVVRNGD